MSRSLQLLFAGAAYGVVASVGITLGRWLTWEPYSPMIIPYDIVVCAVSLGLSFAVAGSIMTGFGRERYWGPFACGILLIFYGTLFYGELYGTGGGTTLKIFHGIALLGAAAMFVRHSLRNRTGKLRYEWLCLIVGVAFAMGLEGYEYWKGFSLTFPVVVVLSLARGIPTAKSSLERSFLAPLAVTGAVIALCSFVVAPGSAQLVSPIITTQKKSGNSVILIVLDTLRRDHMSLYGYHRKTTPHLDKWAENALVFDDMTAASSWTLPSHASMFTGLYPRSHGVHGFRGQNARGNTFKLADSKTTLAELATRAGIASGAIIANHFYLMPQFGLDQGFMTYWVGRPKPGVTLPPADWLRKNIDPYGYAKTDWPYYRDEYITDNAIRWLQTIRETQFFLFINYMDVHIPNEREPTIDLPIDDEASYRDHHYDLLFVLEGKPLPPRIRKGLVNSYDRELFHLDKDLTRLFSYLESTGLEARTTVIVTSDHGEYFGEHELIDHSKHLHNEVLNVPFIVKGPHITPGRSSKPVQSVDLFATILTSLGIDHKEDTAGFSLPGSERHEIVSEWYASESRLFLEARFNGRFDRDLRAIRSGRFKLFEDEHGNCELYDIEKDPKESINLCGERKEVVEEMKSLLAEWLQAQPRAKTEKYEEAEMDREHLDQIKALGYVH
jgi:arylsulfatase A-like enzyme